MMSKDSILEEFFTETDDMRTAAEIEGACMIDYTNPDEWPWARVDTEEE